MKEKIVAVKNHVVEHKAAYISGAICFVAGAAGATVVLANGIVLIDAFNPQILSYKPIHTHVSETTVINPIRGHRGNKIYCDQTGITYPSQNVAAAELGLKASNLSSHLHGKNAHVGGYTFANLGENV
jgi:hypothetical protein